MRAHPPSPATLHTPRAEQNDLKALYRRGQAFLGLQDWPAARRDLKRAVKLAELDAAQRPLIQAKLEQAEAHCATNSSAYRDGDVVIEDVTDGGADAPAPGVRTERAGDGERNEDLAKSPDPVWLFLTRAVAAGRGERRQRPERGAAGACGAPHEQHAARAACGGGGDDEEPATGAAGGRREGVWHGLQPRDAQGALEGRG